MQDEPSPRRRVYSAADRRRRDLTILTLLSHGYTARQIGPRVGLSESSVNTRMLALRDEFEARNVTHLVATALREGVIA